MFNVKTVAKRHFIVEANEPVRIEVITTDEGQLIMFGYKGLETDIEQEPDILFDSIS